MTVLKNLYLCCLLVAFGNVFFGICKNQNEATASMNCASLLDVTILLDASGSVRRYNWENVVVPFVKDILNSLNIGEKNVHTAVATYDNMPVKIKWKLDAEANYDKNTLLQAVEKLKKEYTGQNTYTGAALKKLNEDVIFGPGHRPEAPKLLILVTDGVSHDKPIEPAKKLRDKGVIIMVVGVANANDKQCREIAGCKSDDRNCALYRKSNWNSLIGEVSSIVKVACEKLPKDAICNEWSDWSPCSKTCGIGFQTRSVAEPVTIMPAEPGDNQQMGRTCEELYPVPTERKECMTVECPIDAGCGSFGNWSECSKLCGGGTQTRERSIWDDPPAQFGGKTCFQQNLRETENRSCNTTPCPIHAQVGPWTEWSPCSETCGWGTKKRERKEIITAQFGGRTLEDQRIRIMEEESCKYFDCGPCVFHWAPWTACTSHDCDQGIKSRHRAVKFDYPDHKCPEITYETSSCDKKDCEEPFTPEAGGGGGGEGGGESGKGESGGGESGGGESGGGEAGGAGEGAGGGEAGGGAGGAAGGAAGGEGGAGGGAGGAAGGEGGAGGGAGGEGGAGGGESSGGQGGGEAGKKGAGGEGGGGTGEGGKTSEPAGASNTAAIAGGIVGGLALLGAAGAGGYFYSQSPGAGGPSGAEAAETGVDQHVDIEEQEVAVDINTESEAWQ